MTKEKLLEWGLTEEQATKVMEGLERFLCHQGPVQ